MLANNIKAYLSESLFRYSTLGYAPNLTHKNKGRLERLVKDEHSSFLQKFVNYALKKFNNTGPQVSIS